MFNTHILRTVPTFFSWYWLSEYQREPWCLMALVGFGQFPGSYSPETQFLISQIVLLFLIADLRGIAVF